MIDIKQSSAARALVFFMADSSNHVTGKTGLSPTVLLSKNGGTFASPSGAVTEIGNGFYKVAANGTDSNTLGILALSATATGADQAAMAFNVVAYDPDDAAALGLSRIDVAISSRLATAGYISPDNAGITAIKARTDLIPNSPAIAGEAAAALNAYDPPTRAEATADKQAILDRGNAAWTTGSSGGGGSDPWATVLPGDYEDGTAGAILNKLNITPEGQPVAVLPGPPADAAMCRVFGDLETPDGELAVGAEIKFKLVTIASGPTKAERLIYGREVSAITDETGRFEIDLQRNDQQTPAKSYWIVNSELLGFCDVRMVLNSETRNIDTMVN